MNDEGGEPEFDPELPMGNAGANVAVGSTVAFKAVADEGYVFVCWTNKDTEEFYSFDKTIYVEATEAMNLTAVFDTDVDKFTFTAKTSQGGQIAYNVDGGDPEFDPDFPMNNIYETIPEGDTITLSAKADEGYKFFYWIDEDAGTIYSTDATIQVTVDKNINLVAAFDLDVERVLIIANSSQGGQVGMNEEGGDPFDDPEAISGGNCGGNIAVGNTVAFGAKADEGWKFICWMNEETEELYSMDETIYVTAEKPLTLKAVFDMDVERVLLYVKTGGRGQVALNEDGDDPEFEEGFHNDNVGTRVIPGDSVVIGALADDGYKFVGWKNAATGEIISTEETFVVFVEEDMEIVAVFELADSESGNGSNSGSNNSPANNNNTTPSNNNTTPSNGTSTPATGDTASAAALAAVTLGSLGMAVMFGKKRKEEE